jgi:hypothetical protein
MAEDRANDLPLRDDGDDAQRPLLAKRAADHIHVKDPLEQPCPAPARRRRACRRLGEALLPGRREDRPPQMAVRRQAAAIAHEMHVRQGHEGGQLLQEFQWREPNARGPVRPRMREGVDQIAVGVLDQALESYRTAGGRADELFSLIPPVGRDSSVGVERKPVDTGTPRPREPWRLALGAKA